MSASFPLAKANTSQIHIYTPLTVYSNHDRPQDNHVRRFLQRHGIPYHYLPTAPGNKREQEILELIQGTDFVVLARYMQVNNTAAPFFFFFF
jgi:formyltetrahydrofolate hydrolase